MFFADGTSSKGAQILQCFYFLPICADGSVQYNKSLSFGALTISKNTSESWANPAKSSPWATATKKKKFEIKWKQSMHLRFVGGWALGRPPNLVGQGPYNNQDPTLSCTRITQSFRYNFSKRWEIEEYTALFSHCPLSFWVDVRDDRAMNSHESPYQAIPLPRPSPVVILGQGKGGMVGFNDFNRLVNEPWQNKTAYTWYDPVELYSIGTLRFLFCLARLWTPMSDYIIVHPCIYIFVYFI